MSYYIEHVKYYSDNSKWLAKLFLQFCHEYKFQTLFESSMSDRRMRFDYLINNPITINGTTLFFETREKLLEHYNYGETHCSPVYYRLFMWRYFLITHQDHIPQYFKSYIGINQLLTQLRIDGTRNDKRLENIFKILAINNE